MPVNLKYRTSSTATKPANTSVVGAPLSSLDIDGNMRAIKDAIDALESSSGSTTASSVSYTSAGTGAVATHVQAVLRRTIHVADFGALGTGIGQTLVDETSKVQAAIDYCQSVDGVLEFDGTRRYRLGSLTFKHGKSATDTMSYNVRVRGNGAVIYSVGTGFCFNVVPRCLITDESTGRGEADIEISGFWFDGWAAPTSKVLSIGQVNMKCSNFAWSRIADITIAGYTAGTNVVRFLECRHIDITNLTTRSGTVTIECPSGSRFCGDMTFHSCEFNGTASSRPILVTASGTGSNVRGLTFSSCDFYTSGTKLESTGSGALVADIWFTNGCQFDGPGAPSGERALEITSTAGNINQIHILHCYFVTYTGYAVLVVGTGTGTITQVNVQGCMFGTINNSSAGNSILKFVECDSISVRDCEFDLCTTSSGDTINFDKCNNAMVTRNKSTRMTNTSYGVTYGNTSSTNYIITENLMNCSINAVNEYSNTTPNRVVVNNIRY